MARKEERVIRLDKPSGTAFQSILSAFGQLGIRVTQADAAVGTIVATQGASLTSWGEIITVQLQPVGQSVTDVLISSESSVKMTVVDWGKNAKNLDNLVRQIVRQISMIP